MIDFSAQITRWRRQAEEYRTLADGAKVERARETYLRMAADYDALADRAEETLAAVEALNG
jgi:hypothetical protein